MAQVWISIPVELKYDSGAHPDQGLPEGGSGARPDQGLPEGGGTPSHPIHIPPEVWPTPPGGGAPTHPIYVPVYPDQGLPGSQPGPDNSLPGGGGSPTQPIYLPVFPNQGLPETPEPK